MEESIFPHSRALYDPEQMEEERRLCYVAMTRAKEELILSYATRRLLFGDGQHNPPSRFLSDLDAEVGAFQTVSDSQKIDPHYNPWDQTPVQADDSSQLDVQVGDRVRHKIFGVGTIHKLEADVATISFSSRGSKKLNIAFAPLEKL
jgi:DNA helicase-2/ATP-dependent DNA helicase PcrA